jgi:uncharacterized coiled-coil protein SlyX
MALSNNLVDEFAKLVTEPKEEVNTVYNGEFRLINGKKYVRIDGSEVWTPIQSTVDAKDGDRVIVNIKDHIATLTGNLTDPAARTTVLNNLSNEVDEFGNSVRMLDNTVTMQKNSIAAINNHLSMSDSVINAHEVAINAHDTYIQTINSELDVQDSRIQAVDSTVKTQGDTINSINNSITAQENIITALGNTVEAQNNRITANSNNILLQGNTIAAQGNNILLNNSSIQILNSGFTIQDGVLTGLSAAVINSLKTNNLDAAYANIDFSNIGVAAVENIFANYGIIDDIVVQQGKITGELVGVTIKGDLIEANTIKADKLVVQGNDGLFYKLNISGESVSAEQTQYNSLSGSVITAHSITADKVQVSDLVAFGATIGGFHITANSLYSGAKSSVDNTTRGIYLDNTGQIAIGDDTNKIKYYLDTNDNKWKLDITANDLHLGLSSKSVAEEMEEIKENVTTYLHIESSRGTVFKNNSVSTILSVSVYRGADRITNITDLRSAFGNGVYLQWKWKRLNDNDYGIISSSDSRISENGFKFTLSPADVDTKVTFLCELMV